MTGSFASQSQSNIRAFEQSSNRAIKRTGPQACPRNTAAVPPELKQRHVRGLKSFRTVDHFKLDCGSLLQRAEALSLNGGEVDEDVLAALAPDETIALGV